MSEGGGRPARDRRETQEVRQYRFVLATATTDALLGLHEDVLRTVGPAEVGQVLRTLRDRTGTGVHLTADRVTDVARLYVLSETRDPGTVRDALPARTLQAVAATVLVADSAFGLFAGYADWDGSDRAGPGLEGDDGFTPRSWGNRNATGPIVTLSQNMVLHGTGL